jgi:hypothetical protein
MCAQRAQYGGADESSGARYKYFHRVPHVVALLWALNLQDLLT